MKDTFSYLALGDSYTVGENIPLHENFPYKAVQLLRREGLKFHAPEIIAQTGWTTGELLEAISQTELLPPYDLVTLLIGVNNQYRSYSLDEYKREFEALLKLAIVFSGNHTDHIMILSIPDWGVTPFADGRHKTRISDEIDAFNKVNRQISEKYKVHYIDITPGTRLASADQTLLAADGLHYSGKEHHRWANEILKHAAVLLTDK